MSLVPVDAAPWTLETDAPTHLPETIEEELPTHFARSHREASEPTPPYDVVSSATRQPKRTPAQPAKVAAPTRTPVPSRAAAPSHASVPSRSPAPALPPPPAAPAQAQAPVTPPRMASAPVMPQLPPVVQTPDGLSFDPLLVPLPPEVAPSVYEWVRRIALQADLAGADRVLRDALGDLTGSLACLVVYPGQDGLYSLGADDEMPADQEPLIACARARRAIVSAHNAIVPITTTNETVGVIALARNTRQPAYGPAEQLAMAALAREAAGVLAHLSTLHLQRAAERAADKGGLYRPEALESHRTRGQEGVVAELSPRWVRRTYPIIILSFLVAIVLGTIVKVPTYSAGSGVIVFEGTPITAPAPGTVEDLRVRPGDAVKKGQVLVRLHSTEQEADLARATAELEEATATLLFDFQDGESRGKVALLQAQVRQAQSRLNERIVVAPRDGVVSDIRLTKGQLLQAGDHVLSLVDKSIDPTVTLFLPGSDRPRLHTGMDLQVEIEGYTKKREIAKITFVDQVVIGTQEARHTIGPQLADSIKLADGSSYVLVKAKLPSRKFKTQTKEYDYRHGMPIKAEVKLDSRRFIVTLLPTLGKYLD